MPHPCYICGQRVSNPLQDVCNDHEAILQSLAEQERMKNKKLSDFFSSGLEKEIFQLEKVSEVM